jgi:hypothetical protein
MTTERDDPSRGDEPSADSERARDAPGQAPREERTGEPERNRRKLVLLAVLVALLLAATGAWIAHKGVVLKPDSRSYLRADVHRSAGYPALIALVRRIFGRSMLPALVAIQAALGLAAATALALYLGRRFRLGVPTALLVLAILLSPYWTLSVGNLVLSQALAYPLLLLAFRFLVSGVADRRERDLFVYLALAFGCVLVRPQFLFVHSISLVAVFCAVRGASRVSHRVLLAGALAASLLAPSVIDRTWRWAHYGHFAGLPYLGQQLVTGAVYLAQPDDARLFEGKTRELFLQIHEQAEREHLLEPPKLERHALHVLPGVRVSVMDVRHFDYVYNKIAWRIAFETAARIFCPGCDRAAQFYAVDPPLREISFALMKAHAGKRLELYLSSLLVATTPVEWLVLIVAFAAALHAAVSRNEPAGMALALAVLLHVSNLALVALVEPELDRYTFSTASIYLVSLVLFLHSAAAGRPASAGVVSPPCARPRA